MEGGNFSELKSKIVLPRNVHAEINLLAFKMFLITVVMTLSIKMTEFHQIVFLKPNE